MGRRSRSAAVVSVAALAGLLVVPITATPAGALTVLTVDTTADTVDATPGDGLCKDAAGDCSLRAAVIEANALGIADTYEIVVPAGTFTLTIPGTLEDASLTGDLDLDCCIERIRGAGSGLTTIDAGGLDRALHVLPNPLDPFERGFPLAVVGVTITGGSITEPDPSGWSGGGGILSRAETLNLDDVVVRGNVVDLGGSGCERCALGGGILTGWAADLWTTDAVVDANAVVGPGAAGGGAYVYGSMSIAGSTFSANTVDTSEPFDDAAGFQHGAGLAMDAWFSEGVALGVTITDSSFADNQQLGGGVLYGGGLSLFGAEATIDRVTVTGNSATHGGGAFISDWGLTDSDPAAIVTDAELSGNDATGLGGGIAVGANLGPGVDVVSSTISGNTADSGGGTAVFGDGSHLRLERSTVSGNTATTSGGAGFTDGWFSGYRLETSTVSGNSAPTGGGLFVGTDGYVDANRSTIVANSATTGGGIAGSSAIQPFVALGSTGTVFGPQAAGNDCAFDDGSGGPGLVTAGSNADSDGTCDLTDPTDQPGVDPLLGPLADNGGTTLTHLPGAGSPLLDAAGVCSGNDQRGVVRPQGAACDIGAVEVPEAVPVQVFSDVDPAHPFFVDVWWAFDAGLVQGFADGTFRPSALVSRQALVAVLWREAGSPAGPFADPGFSDVPASHPFATAIAWAKAEGLVDGYADGTFRPGGATSRQALVAVLWRDAGSPAGPFADPGFSDVPASHPFATAIAWAKAEGLVRGYADGTCRPTAKLTRQALVAILHAAA